MSSSLYGVQWPGAGYLVSEESDTPDSYLAIVVDSFRFHPDIFINRSILSAFFACTVDYCEQCVLYIYKKAFKKKEMINMNDMKLSTCTPYF